MTNGILLHPADRERDFGQLAALFSSIEDETTTETGLREDYEKHKERILNLNVAENQQGALLGFNWVTRDQTDPTRATFYLIVEVEHRRQGVGSRLYADVEQAARDHQVKTLRISLRDNCAECRAFADQRGFNERRHLMAMALDLEALDDKPYDAIIERLQGEGFEFTCMAELGNTEEAQRKLYALNDTTAATTPGTDGEHSWASFEDFQQSVCQSKWYKPEGQMVVIETSTGAWAAMSAITRFEGVDYAYNLFTGVDLPYRGRKLAQAVKVLALRYARQTLGVQRVQTHHNTKNLPMIAIDRKLGYVQTPGFYLMEKQLD